MSKRRRSARLPAAAEDLRIIGGRFRRQRLKYSGDPRTRPMKHRVREAAFNLIGPIDPTIWAVDLFAGTGALALEAISRGAAGATLIERHQPSARLIEQNASALGVQQQTRVRSSDTFFWLQRDAHELPAESPWLVFCSPPFDFYQQRRQEMLDLLAQIQRDSPADSVLLAEFPTRFPAELLPDAEHWDVRAYPPAVLGLWRQRPRRELAPRAAL